MFMEYATGILKYAWKCQFMCYERDLNVTNVPLNHVGVLIMMSIQTSDTMLLLIGE